MKVCILTTSFPAHRGHFQSPFIYELAKHLTKNKIDLHVVCPFYKNSKKEETWGNIKIHRFQYFYPKFLQKLTSGGGIPSNLKTSFMAKLQFPFFIISMFFKARKIAKKCDIIHAQWALSALVGIFIKKPIVLTTRGEAVNSALRGKLSKKILLYILKKCNYIVPNNYKHELILNQLNLPRNKIKTITNGVNINLFKPRNKIKARKTLNLPEDKKIILSVGWLIKRKGHNYLLDAIPELIKQHKDLLFIIIGNGILKKNLLNKSKKLGITNHVKFIKAQEPNKIPIWMNAADIFILSSLSEGRPNVIAEALASGLPVIATKVSGTPEFITHKENGLLINPKSTKAIINSINLLYNNSKKLEKNSRKSILDKKLGWDDCAKNYIDIYKKILK
jgi:glycosyltransferase involved in cell wall biosynthesis